MHGFKIHMLVLWGLKKERSEVPLLPAPLRINDGTGRAPPPHNFFTASLVPSVSEGKKRERARAREGGTATPPRSLT